jgi:N-methylhydantoinase A
VQGVTYRVQVTVPTEKVEYEKLEKTDGQPEPKGKTTLRFLGDGDVEAFEFWREDLRQGHVIEGPALIREEVATTQVVEGQIATIGQYGEITITQGEES